LNNPLALLRRVLAIPTTTHGVVVRCVAGSVHIATSGGLVAVASSTVLYPGDAVTVTGGTIARSAKPTAIYPV
jgi:hypothetical protein